MRPITARRAANAAPRGHFRLHRGGHLGGHVDDLLEDVQFEVRALRLGVAGGGIEPVAEQILARLAQLLEGVGGDVVVGDEQPVRGDEPAAAAAVEPHRGAHGVVEPLVGQVEPVLVFEQRLGGAVEQPHAFVRNRRHGADSDERECQRKVVRSHGGNQKRRGRDALSHRFTRSFPVSPHARPSSFRLVRAVASTRRYRSLWETARCRHVRCIILRDSF
jgi:hypothetical protein